MTPGIDWDRLDNDTAGNVRFVLGRLPGWEEYATTTDTGAVRFAVPCPVREGWDEVDGLWVWIDDAELTVGFGDHHDHYDAYTVDSRSESLSAGLDWVVDVLTDEVGVLAYSAEGRLLMSTWAELPVADWPPTSSWTPTSYDRVTLRTWSGDGDRAWTAG